MATKKAAKKSSKNAVQAPNSNPEALTLSQKRAATRKRNEIALGAEEATQIPQPKPSYPEAQLANGSHEAEAEAVASKAETIARLKEAKLDGIVADAKAEQSAPTSAAISVKSLEEMDEMAKALLGPDGIVWTASHDAKGNAFPAPLYRVGVTTDKPGRYVEVVGDGFGLMVGTGPTFAQAYRSAKKNREATA